MKKLLIALLVVILISGCSSAVVEIDTNKMPYNNKDCADVIGVEPYARYVELACISICRQEGRGSLGFKCSASQTVICRCS